MKVKLFFKAEKHRDDSGWSLDIQRRPGKYSLNEQRFAQEVRKFSVGAQ